MYYGLNMNNEKVHIESSIKGDAYICPICKSPLIRKCGSLKAHHFAHKTTICDDWYSDNKGEWHRNMQSHFKPEQCEVRIEDKDGNFHIADVFIAGKTYNTIIEFQHSPISKEEFDARNEFYSKNNYVIDDNGNKHLNQVIWVFDCKEKPMYISLSNTDAYCRQVKASEDEMCQEYLSSSYRRYKNTKFASYVVTQENMTPINGVWAYIDWKRASRIFSNTPDNVIIYFDVHQRKYVEGEYEGWHGYTNHFIKFLNEFDTKPDDKPFDDSMYDFMICLTDFRTQYSRNYDLIHHPERIKGRVILYQTFYDFYGKEA